LKTWLIEASRLLRPERALEYSGEVAAEQAWLLSRTCFVYAIFGTTSIALITADFWGRIGCPGITAAAMIPVLYGLLLLRVRALYRSDDTSRFLRSALCLLSLVGIDWGFLIYVLGLNSDYSQRSLLAAVMVGLVSTPIITVPFSAALAFLIPCGISSILTLGVILRPRDPFLLLCFTGYLSFVYVSTVLLNRFSLERAATRIRLQHQNEVISLFLRDYQENATDWLWETDRDLRFQNISPRFAVALKAVPADLRRAPLRQFAASDDRISGLSAVLEMCERRQAFRDVALRFDLDQGARWWSITGQPVYDTNARFKGYRGIGSDITEARRSESKIQYLATHDSLTGLPNRSRFITELEAFCMNAVSPQAEETRRGRSTGPSFALLLLDLDRFKDVNDTYGHPTGDALLVAVAERLQRVLRDGGFPARLGGDEFAILLPVADAAEASVVASRIIQTLQEAYAFRDLILHPGASVGITVAPADGTDAAELMRNADLALYAVKTEGRGAWRCYRPGMDADQTDRAAIRMELKSAVAADDFHVEYQPIIDLATMRIAAIEALVRWNHPVRGMISPSVFVPIAEESGLICEIGATVLDRACQAAASWPGDLRLAVNVSALQLRDPDFLSLVDRALLASGLAPGRLEVELTERVLLDENENSFSVIARLHQRGVRIILDDFGTGYASLATLTRFEFDGFKIDGRFTAALETDGKARAIVRSIGRIAADMALPVTAEGIETPTQLRLLTELGISRGQGFLIGRPQDVEGLLQIRKYLGAETASS